jgi:2-oxoisovalerate dehydrogenase E2 component (dihydrolipoyl transacylase)
VLKLAAEHGIDLSLVRGSGIEGRVTRQDVMRYLEDPAAYTAPPPETAGVVGVPAPAEPAARAEGEGAPADGERVVPLTPARRTIAARMTESHRTVPVAWMAVEADVTQLVALRERVKDAFERENGVRLTYLPFFIQSICGALKEHPALNATFSDAGITLHSKLDLGIAIATDWGLVVPVIRGAGDKSIAGLARELEELGARARDRKLTLDEMRGATLTIDNTGAFGSIISQPIVPVGQVAIITTEAVRHELRPTAEGGPAPRAVMNLCLSFDHRALDGAAAGRFMQNVRTRLEEYRAEQEVY